MKQATESNKKTKQTRITTKTVMKEIIQTSYLIKSLTQQKTYMLLTTEYLKSIFLDQILLQQYHIEIYFTLSITKDGKPVKYVTILSTYKN